MYTVPMEWLNDVHCAVVGLLGCSQRCCGAAGLDLSHYIHCRNGGSNRAEAKLKKVEICVRWHGEGISFTVVYGAHGS